MSDLVDAFKDVGDLLSSGLEGIDPFIKVMTLVEGFKSGQSADSLASMSEAQIAAAVAAAEKVRKFYEEGGKAMSSNMQALLENFGNFGQVTPSNLSTFVEKVAEWRTGEEDADKADYDDTLGSTKTAVSEETSSDEGMFTDTEGTFRSFAEVLLGQSDDLYQGRDARAKADAPSTFDMARDFDNIAAKFTNVRMQNAKRAIDNAYGNALASIPAGFENSTMRVAMETSMADLAAQQQNQAILDGITDAQGYISGLQTATSNEQNMTNAERNMASGLTTAGLNYATGSLGNSIAGGTYGQGYANAYNDIEGYNLDYQSRLANSPFNYLANLDALTTGTSLADYTSGVNLMSNNANLASGYVDTVANQVTKPYSYAATGNANSTTALNNAANNAASLAELYGNQASSNFYSTGYGDEEKL